mmetsp:Transcript_94223/g.304960  ORF Transcript_94223/g.304960 Transcript_94223/m.304960 type:complete len:206 (-) Transcript_94223:135-752(-)
MVVGSTSLTPTLSSDSEIPRPSSEPACSRTREASLSGIAKGICSITARGSSRCRSSITTGSPPTTSSRKGTWPSPHSTMVTRARSSSSSPAARRATGAGSPSRWPSSSVSPGRILREQGAQRPRKRKTMSPTTASPSWPPSTSSHPSPRNLSLTKPMHLLLGGVRRQHEHWRSVHMPFRLIIQLAVSSAILTSCVYRVATSPLVP